MAFGIGSIAAAAGLGGLSDIATSAFNWYAQKDLQGESQDWQRYVMQNQKQWQVEDLKKAGLNPVLATGLGVSAPSSPTPSFTGATSQGMREALASVRKRESQLGDQQLEKLKAETKAAEAVARSASAQAVKDETEAKTMSGFWNGKPKNTRDALYLTSIMGSNSAQMAGHALNIGSFFGDFDPLGPHPFFRPLFNAIGDLWQEAKKRYKDTSAKDVPKAPEGHVILDGKPVKLRFKRDARDQM